MPRVSFTLRRAVDVYGSYLRHDLADRPDNDTSLRADGLQFAPLEEFEVSFFEARSVCYGEVELSWGVTLEAIDTDPVPIGIVLVYSPDGEPQTIAQGDVIVEDNVSGSHVPVSSVAHTGLHEGRWAYYSLFVHFASTGGDEYYELVASLKELVPKNYSSNLVLWNRIPAYYREQDALMGSDYSSCIGTVPYDGRVGPLYKFFSIFGFDMDRTRTLLDYILTAKDPEIADSEVLDALAEQMGVPLRTTDLGAARLRRMTNDIGFFRRSKGTPESLLFLLKALSGSDAAIDQTGGTVTIYSQRVNYVKTPLDPEVLYRSADPSEIPTDAPPISGTSLSYMTLPGGVSTESYISTPDAAAFDITGDIEIVARIALDDWMSSSGQAIIAKYTGSTNLSWAFQIVSGNLQLVWSANGSFANVITDTFVLTGYGGAGFDVPGSTHWVKVAFDVNNAGTHKTATFSVAPDAETEPTSWMYSTVIDDGGVAALYSSSSPVTIGSLSSGVDYLLAGKIYRVRVRNGIDGPVVGDFRAFDALPKSGTIWSAGAIAPFSSGNTGEIWTPHADVSLNSTALIRLVDGVPVRLGDIVSFSVHGGVGSEALKWMRLVTATDDVAGASTVPLVRNGVRGFVAEVVSEATDMDWTTVYVEFLVDISVPFDLSEILVERNQLGTYFDGDTVRGGWLLGPTTSISDYRWRGDPNDSVSLFTDDYERTKGIINDVLFTAFPVTEASKYTITFDAVPGL